MLSVLLLCIPPVSSSPLKLSVPPKSPFNRLQMETKIIHMLSSSPSYSSKSSDVTQHAATLLRATTDDFMIPPQLGKAGAV